MVSLRNIRSLTPSWFLKAFQTLTFGKSRLGGSNRVVFVLFLWFLEKVKRSFEMHLAGPSTSNETWFALQEKPYADRKNKENPDSAKLKKKRDEALYQRHKFSSISSTALSSSLASLVYPICITWNCWLCFSIPIWINPSARNIGGLVHREQSINRTCVTKSFYKCQSECIDNW